MVQVACAKLLMAIYEQDFLSCRYGYRPGRGAMDAVKDLTLDQKSGYYGLCGRGAVAPHPAKSWSLSHAGAYNGARFGKLLDSVIFSGA